MNQSYLTSQANESKLLLDAQESDERIERKVTAMNAQKKRRAGKLFIDQRKQLDIKMQDIKREINIRRLTAQAEIRKNQLRVIQNEKDISFLSKDHAPKWKKIQGMVNFLSAMRSIMRGFRNYGIEGYRHFAMGINNQVHDKKCFLIYSDSFFIQMHSFFLLFILLYLMAYLPLDIAFAYSAVSDNYFLLIIEYVITGYLTLDIMVNFCLATPRNVYKDWIDDWKEISWNYAKRHLWFDLLVVVPFSAFIVDHYSLNARFLVVPSITRLANSLFQRTPTKLASRELVYERIKLLVTNGNTLHILKSIFFTLLFIHLSACFWCYFCRLNDPHWIYRY